MQVSRIHVHLTPIELEGIYTYESWILLVVKLQYNVQVSNNMYGDVVYCHEAHVPACFKAWLHASAQAEAGGGLSHEGHLHL